MKKISDMIDSKFLIGAYLKVEDDLDTELSPTYRIDQRVLYTDLGDDSEFEIVIRANDQIERDRVEVLVDLLRQATVWTDTDNNYEDPEQVIGTLTMEHPEARITSSKVSGVQIHHLTLKSVIEDSSGATGHLSLRLSFIDKQMLHGLSIFHDKVITPRSMPELAYLISTNAFGEMPVLATYDGKYTKTIVTPYGYGDTLTVTNGVMTVYGYTSTIAVDLEGSHTKITITDSGYTMDVELKDKTHLYIYL